MRMEEATKARRAAAEPDAVKEAASTVPMLAAVSAMTGLALFTMMSPFFLNPPLFVTMLMIPRGR